MASAGLSPHPVAAVKKCDIQQHAAWLSTIRFSRTQSGLFWVWPRSLMSLSPLIS